ncbi:MAG: 5-(carboxyamino)imidazole ribonucleotide synthase [Flavobacteriales bacterium]
MEQFYSKDVKIGVLGGGQLGRMLFQAALNLDIHLYFLDPSPSAPCAKLTPHFETGDLQNFDDVVAFGKDKNYLTIEIEHVNTKALRHLETLGVKVYPQAEVIEMIQDKGLQKQFYKQHNIPTSDFQLIQNLDELEAFKAQGPWVQKLRTGGYDGQGVQVLKTEADYSKAFEAPSLIEKLVDFETEISVIVAKNAKGEVKTYPLVDMEFSEEANLVEFLFSPSELNSDIKTKAQHVALQICETLDFVGILAIEMFVTKTGDVLVNEMAPRPHNSGHHSIEANICSQYEQHLRAILNLPLGDTSTRQSAVMLNLLGEKNESGPVRYEGLEEVLNMPNVFVHLYGKQECKPFRKMGHVTVLADDLETAKATAKTVKSILKVKAQTT